MKHQELQALIPYYVAQTLSSEEERRFEAHLENCESCQADIELWRMIASAVWRETDEVARTLPPLSPEVYNRLNYRDKAPQSRYSTNPPRYQENRLRNSESLQKSKTSLPLTLVAGLVVAFIFGGLLLFFALRRPSEVVEIALDSTALSMTEQFGNSGLTEATATPIVVTPSVTAIGIIPTLDPNIGQIPTQALTQGAPTFFTNTPSVQNTSVVATEIVLPTDTPSTVPDLPPVVEITSDSAVQSVIIEASLTPAPLGGGPYITVTPNTFANGLPLCEVFNPTTIPIEIHIEADRNAEIVGILMPAQIGTVIQMNTLGWYQVSLQDAVIGWLTPEFAYLRGNCLESLPVVSPTPRATATPIATLALSLDEPASESIIVINTSYTDLYNAPSFDAIVLGVAERDEQFTVVGYQGLGVNRWALVRQDDGSEVWIWASVVTEYPADAIIPSRTPQP